MTVCLRVYAALEYRLHQALTNTHTTVPDQKGKHPAPHYALGLPTLAGIHVLLIEGQAARVLDLTPLSGR